MDNSASRSGFNVVDTDGHSSDYDKVGRIQQSSVDSLSF